MVNGKKIIALIPARGGSKGLPGKNIKFLNGKPLIAWSIESALNSKYIDSCVVSTDNQEIKEVSQKAGAMVPFLRPCELATDTASSIDVALHALDFMQGQGQSYDYILLVEPTSPLRDTDDFDNMIQLLVNHEHEIDAVVSVGKVHEHPLIMKKIKNDRLQPFIPSSQGESRRQELEDAFFPYGVGYLVKTSVLRERKTFYPERVHPHVIKRYQCYEIDDIYDFQAVESIMKLEWNLP